jgi:thiol-disulfide isomerase/thioredoxin
MVSPQFCRDVDRKINRVLRGCLLALAPVLALFSVEPSFAAEKLWSLKGRVLDQEGHPVACASVTTNWSANGITLEQLRRIEEDLKLHPEKGAELVAELARNEGRLEPWGLSPAQTDANGNFSLQLHSTKDYKLLAVDRERKHGAVIIVDPRNPPAHVECRLVPLIRVHGRLCVAATGRAVRASGVFVSLPANEDVPLGSDRLMWCDSAKSRFEFWLPPGDYQFEASGTDAPLEESSPGFELTESHPIRLSAGQREFDCGVFALRPKLLNAVLDAKKAGTWRPYTQRYGEPCPKWHVIDARGLPKDAQPSALRGKWVLVYFWGFGCGPCLETTLPKLSKFYEAHRTERDRFELVSICLVEQNTRTMADLDRVLQPIVKKVWGGKELPFPVLLDNTTQSMESFGVELSGVTVLVDPSGRLVAGDASTLAAILKTGK